MLATTRGTVSYRTLARKVWGIRRGEIGSRVRAHMANLRGKLDRGNGSSVIRTDIGLGYRFVGHEGTPADSRPAIDDHERPSVENLYAKRRFLYAACMRPRP